MSNLLQQEANSGSTWGWLFLVRSQEQQVRWPYIQFLLYSEISPLLFTKGLFCNACISHALIPKDGSTVLGPLFDYFSSFSQLPSLLL